MRERLVTALAALATLAVVAMLLAPGRDPAEEASRPLSSDRGNAGLWALQEWARSAGVPVERLGLRYDALLDARPWPARGNLLVVVLPQRVPARARELDALYEWLHRGNHALLLAADGDRGPWAALADPQSTQDVLAGLGFELLPVRSAKRDPHSRGDEVSSLLRGGGSPLDAAPLTLSPPAPHPLLQGVRAVEIAHVPFFDDGSSVAAGDDAQVLISLLVDGVHGLPALWEARLGDGRVWISRYGSLFSNQHLGKADNAPLAGNLLAAALATGGWLIFDDMHQGGSVLYDPDAFFADPRLWISLAFAAGLWLLWVAGRAQRLTPLRAEVQPPRAGDSARVLGGLLARRVTREGAAGALLEHFVADLRARYRLPPSEKPDWDVLERMYAGPRRDLDRLRRLVERLDAGRRVDVGTFARLLRHLRENLA